METQDIFKGYGVKIKLKTDFSKVCEVLTRIGIANTRNKTLTQSAHIFHKRGEYAIMHFKEMFLFDGKEADYTEEDESRRNRIINILLMWDMIEIIEASDDYPVAPSHAVTIISRDMMQKENWNLIKKYTLGRRPLAIAS